MNTIVYIVKRYLKEMYNKSEEPIKAQFSPSNYIIKASFNNIFASQNNYDELNYVQLQEI